MLTDPAAQRRPLLPSACAPRLQGLRGGAAQVGLGGGEDPVQHLLPLSEAAPPAARASHSRQCFQPSPRGWRGGRRSVCSAVLRAPSTPAAPALALAHPQLQVLPEPGLERGGRRLWRARRRRPGLHPPPPAPPLPSPSAAAASSSSTALSSCASCRSPTVVAAAVAATGTAAKAGGTQWLQASAGVRHRSRGFPAARLRRCLFLRPRPG